MARTTRSDDQPARRLDQRGFYEVGADTPHSTLNKKDIEVARDTAPSRFARTISAIQERTQASSIERTQASSIGSWVAKASKLAQSKMRLRRCENVFRVHRLAPCQRGSRSIDSHIQFIIGT